MSSRVTRSSARLAAAAAADNAQPAASDTTPTNNPPPPRPNKRKATVLTEPATQQDPNATKLSPPRRAKRSRATAAENPPPHPEASRSIPKRSAPMAKSGSSPEMTGEKVGPAPPASESTRKKSGRGKKTVPDPEPSASASTAPARRAKKSSAKKTEDAVTKAPGERFPSLSKTSAPTHAPVLPAVTDSDDEDGLDNRPPDGGDGSGEDAFTSGFLGSEGSSAGMASDLHRRLREMSSGGASQFRTLLSRLQQKDNTDDRRDALTQLSNLLLISTEDNLSGQFSPDQFVTELVALMQPNEFDIFGSETELLACRCIANLIEALPPSTANVVYGGAVPVLCEKLTAITDLDMPEQVLSTLEKISLEFPSSIVREGGLTACLQFFDFFPTATQRTAINTAANCCRNISQDSFPIVKEVVGKLLDILNNSDQKVVEKACVCISRIVESFRYQPEKMEELVQPELLAAVRRLLLPGTTNLIGPSIHTQFLRVLSITARASPARSADLFKMDIVDTLYQVLTGVSVPSGLDNVASQIDSVLIMQALIHRPREQIYETLDVICELLPGVHREGLSSQESLFDTAFEGDDLLAIRESSSRNGPGTSAERLKLLEGCKEQLKRFAIILLPTLTSAYQSTVNLSVRQKVLTAHLKMLSNLDVRILEDALRTVQYASFLATILLQQDHPSLVLPALQAADLLLLRMDRVYRNQFYREGVMAEISKLASKPLKTTDTKVSAVKSLTGAEPPKPTLTAETTEESAKSIRDTTAADEASESEGEQDEDDNDDEDDHDDIHDDGSSSPSDSSSDDQDFSPPGFTSTLQDCITLRAKQFLEVHESAKGRNLGDKASKILEELRGLGQEIRKCYLGGGSGNGVKLFMKLSKHFQDDALESMTSAELINSEIGRVLLDVFSTSNYASKAKARAAFLQVFMSPPARGKSRLSTTTVSTPFSMLVHKLQDVLSRSEQFEVITVHHNALDSNRSSAASMLSKQLRLRLVADDESEIPKSYNNMMISIHAIATFKALDDYLRPRISLAERPKPSKTRDRESVSGAMAAFAAAAGVSKATMRPGDVSEEATGNAANPSTSSTATSTSGVARKPSNAKPSTPAFEAKDNANGPRRSNRKNRVAKATPATPVPEPEPAQSPLECADERQLTDDEDFDENSALEALVDDLEDGMEDPEAPDPTAVNMEIAATGKVTARKEDGTRVATPSQGPTSLQHRHSSRAQELLAAGLNHSLASRAMSYAAALQAVPQDWHLSFSIDEQSISHETTIYRAVHYNSPRNSDSPPRNVWSSAHTIKFRRVQGPPPSEPLALAQVQDTGNDADDSSLPKSLHEHPTTSEILRLLNILHELNANLDDVFDDSKESLKLSAEPLSQFVNTKLTAKLNRQLEEPLIVASKCLPPWSEDLPRLYPFLFPFETRHLFLQSTSFGYSRSMTRWQNAQPADDSRRSHRHDDRPYIGRLQRQKVRISRNRILESAIKVMELYGGSPSVLEVEYFEEVGTGLGPTLEFYSTVSKEFSKKELKLWRESDSSESNRFIFSKLGLFPAPMSAIQTEIEGGKKILHYFKILGKFVARAMLDSRIIDVPLNPTFFRVGNQPNTVPLSLGAVKTVDEYLASSLKLVKQFAVEKERIDGNTSLSATKKANAIRNIKVKGASVEEFSLDFTLPGYSSIELIENGSHTAVTIDNVESYVEKVIDMTLGSGVQRQVEAFRAGFSQVFPYTALRAFTPKELEMLFGQAEEDWSLETLLDSIKADHGFNMDSKSVRNLLQVMSELSATQKRDFLQFVTGSPKLPIGGFKALTPMFTVVRKPSESGMTPDDFLVSVMTCANYVKLPDYSDINVLHERLLTAIQEGQGAFHLS